MTDQLDIFVDQHTELVAEAADSAEAECLMFAEALVSRQSRTQLTDLPGESFEDIFA